jgi:hypothetical protein
MKKPKVRIKPKTREKYDYYFSLSDSVRPLPADRVPFDAHGISGVQCFHQLESEGRCWYCNEPESLERYMEGKERHGMTVDMVAEDLLGRVIFNAEVLENYASWVANEIFSAAERLAKKRLGFAPKFISTRRDFTK